MSFSDYLESMILDHVFGGVVYTPPGTIYVGLSRADPGEVGTGLTEPSGGNYSRVGVTNNKSTWSSSSGGTVRNLVPVTFATASSAWGTMTHVFISDSPSGGNILASGPLNPSFAVNSGDTPSFAANNIVLTLD